MTRGLVSLRRINPTILVFVVLLAAICWMSPLYRTPAGLLSLLQRGAPVVILSCGQSFALIAGGFDLAAGSLITLVVVACVVHREQTKIPGGPLEMVFIRAPRIAAIGPEVETLAERDGHPVLVRQGHLMAATFHPELSSDTRVHELFLEVVAKHSRLALAGVPQR